MNAPVRYPAPPHRAQPRSAFTLTELLAVSAIVGMLVAMLLPAGQCETEKPTYPLYQQQAAGGAGAGAVCNEAAVRSSLWL